MPAFSLKASLEYDLLHAAGLVSEPQLMRKKLLRINTKALYTQMKYNLLREESEGFAKVLTLVHTNVSPAQLDATQTDLLALVGYFDLDANRVLDLVLDAYEAQPSNDCFATLLGAFKRASLPHVLGFKFQFYKRDASDGLVTPQSLYRLAATLVAKGLVDVDALLPHLAPSKDAIVAQYAARTKALEAAAQAFGKVNLAAKASDSAEDKSDNQALDDDAHNQVFGLIGGLLAIGADAHAFELIAWFQRRGVNPLASKALSAQLCASVHALIAPLYAPLSLQTMHLVARSGSSVKAAPVVASLTTAAPVTTPEALVSNVFPILEMLGGQLHYDPLLFTKLLRILSHAIERAPKTVESDDDALSHAELLNRVHALIVKSFLPAVTHLGSNPSAVFQLWDLVKLYPFEQRYRLYEQWQAAYATDPEMKLVDAQVVQATRKVMRRLTADRAKPSARSLTHFAHANPLTVFRTMLRQIQSYDNLIQPVVESFKFITPLGMDVLSFVLVRELAASRQAMKADGTNVSLWLASLASFAGSFYRKYPTVELSGLLQYLIQRLRNWESVDLVVLSELLSKMGSCISFEDISLSQLEALAGGPHLGHEPTDPKLMNRRAIPRLRDALVKRDLALPLVLLICQMRSRIEHHEGSPQTHLKLLGRVYDTCQMTLSQLLQFLYSVVDPAAYTAMLPSLTALVREYHIQPELAMTLCRPAMRSDDPVLRRAPRSIHATGASSSSSSSETPARWCIDAPELLADVRAAVLTAPDGAAPIPSDSAFSGMTPDLYVTFWSLVLYDIYVPFAQYEAEIVRLRTSLTAPGGVNNATLTGTERKKLKEKTTQRIDKLTNEQKDQVAHRKRVFERLEATKRAFFAREDNRSAVHALLQTCVIPRALLSPEDALFCAKFMDRLHAIDTPEFSTLQYYNTVNLKLPSIVLCVTEREAGNFGIFLKETLHVLARWYQSAVAYEEDAVHGKSGFSVDLHDPTKTLPHRQYKLVFAKWHKWMAKVFAATLASSEYMPMRNTLIVLTKIIDVFPASKSTAERLLAIVEGLTKEDREDIKIMAKRYFALLTKRKGTLNEDKLLAVATAKKTPVAASPTASATGKDTSAAAGDSSRESKDAAVDGAKPSVRASASAASDAPKASSASESSSRDRKPARVLRPDLESGEISSPPPTSSAATASSSAPPAGRSSSSRRSSERPSSTAAPGAAESARERENRQLSSGSRLKRRDSDRADESAASSGRPGDEKRGRREQGRDGRELREGREASPGKPPLASSGNNNSVRGNGADAPASGGRKRDRSRERRSRSVDGRRNGRERSDNASANAPASTAPAAPASKDTSAAGGSAGHVSDAPKRESDDASGESRKRQRLELSEAQLRRQLTEKKDQEQRRERMDASSKSDGPAPRASESSGLAARTGGDAERSERPQTTSSAPGGAGSSARKMVSLVSTSRKREEDSERAAAATPGAPDNADDRRRRDSGRGGGGNGGNGGGGNGGGHGSRGGGGDSSDTKQRSQQDEKKRRRDRKHGDGNNGAAGSGNVQQQQQQRDQRCGRCRCHEGMCVVVDSAELTLVLLCMSCVAEVAAMTVAVVVKDGAATAGVATAGVATAEVAATMTATAVAAVAVAVVMNVAAVGRRQVPTTRLAHSRVVCTLQPLLHALYTQSIHLSIRSCSPS